MLIQFSIIVACVQIIIIILHFVHMVIFIQLNIIVVQNKYFTMNFFI